VGMGPARVATVGLKSFIGLAGLPSPHLLCGGLET